MEDQVLPIEQMQELIELGIDTSKASMCWMSYPSLLNKDKRTKELVINSSVNKRYFYITSTAIDYTTVLEIPTFTLQDILNVLPEKITYDGRILDLKIVPIYGKVAYEDGKGRCVGVLSKSILQSAFSVLKNWLNHEYE